MTLRLAILLCRFFLYRLGALEIRIGLPPRISGFRGNLFADRVERLHILDHAAQIPVRVVLVDGLVVDARGDVLVGLVAGGLTSAHEIQPTACVQHRHADLGEVELIGAEEEALLRRVVRDDVAILFLCSVRDVFIEIRLPETDHGNVMARSDDGQRIHVDRGDGPVQGKHRMRHVVA